MKRTKQQRICITIFCLLVFCVGGCSSRENRILAAGILWSDSQNGLSMGIDQPASPFVFEPIKDWSGPLILEQRNVSGQLTGFSSNPGGRWRDTAVLKVYIRNTSDTAIFWSMEHDVWSIAFTGANAPKPIGWPGPKPSPIRNGPVRLDPGAQREMQFNLTEAGDVWPSVSRGNYTVLVSYSPNRLLTFGTGGKGNWTHPYDVTGFWKGTIATPPVAIGVEYPR